eukprot:1188250-Prymnesium_polylepis.1
MMEESPPMSIRDFRRYARSQDSAVRGLSADDLGAKFWRGVAGGAAPLYGADSSEIGSLFPPDLKTWNLSALPAGVDNVLLQAGLGFAVICWVSAHRAIGTGGRSGFLH